MKHLVPSFHKLLTVTLGVFTVSLLMPSSTIGQATTQSAVPVLTQAQLEELLNTASAHIDKYNSSLKELTAEETRTIQTYNKQGKLTCERRTVSDFVLYQPQRDPTQAAEYRNVREVNGKQVSNQQKRVEKLFARVAKAEASDKAEQIRIELDRLNREGTRYNCGVPLFGQIIYKALALHKMLRPHVSFKAVGREQLNGHDVVVIQYQQSGPRPELNVGEPPSEVKGSKIFLRGQLWLDAESAQLWREDREYITRSPLVADPLVVTRLVSEYAPGVEGLWLPQRIAGQVFNNVRVDQNRRPELSLSVRDTNEYGQFKCYAVIVEEGSVTPSQP